MIIEASYLDLFQLIRKAEVANTKKMICAKKTEVNKLSISYFSSISEKFSVIYPLTVDSVQPCIDEPGIFFELGKLPSFRQRHNVVADTPKR
jgi:hypothetical protein